MQLFSNICKWATIIGAGLGFLHSMGLDAPDMAVGILCGGIVGLLIGLGIGIIVIIIKPLSSFFLPSELAQKTSPDKPPESMRCPQCNGYSRNATICKKCQAKSISLQSAQVEIGHIEYLLNELKTWYNQGLIDNQLYADLSESYLTIEDKLIQQSQSVQVMEEKNRIEEPVPTVVEEKESAKHLEMPDAEKVQVKIPPAPELPPPVKIPPMPKPASIAASVTSPSSHEKISIPIPKKVEVPTPVLPKIPISARAANIFAALTSEQNIKRVLYIGVFLLVSSIVVFLNTRWEVMPNILKLTVVIFLTFGCYLSGYLIFTRLNIIRTGISLIVLASLLIPLDFHAAFKFGMLPIKDIFMANINALITCLILYTITAILLNSRIFIYLSGLCGAVILGLSLYKFNIPYHSYGLSFAILGFVYLGIHQIARQLKADLFDYPFYISSMILMGLVQLSSFYFLDRYFGVYVNIGMAITTAGVIFFLLSTFVYNERRFIYPAMILLTMLTAFVLRYYMIPIREWSLFIMILGSLMVLAGFVVKDEEISMPLYRVGACVSLLAFIGVVWLILTTGNILWHDIIAILIGALLTGISGYFTRNKYLIYSSLILFSMLTAFVLRYYMIPIREWSLFIMILGSLMVLAGFVVKDEEINMPLYRVGACVSLLAFIGVVWLILTTGNILWQDIIAILIGALLTGISGYFIRNKYLIYSSLILCSIAYLLTLLILNIPLYLLGIWTIGFSILMLILGYLLKKTLFAVPLKVISQIGCTLSFLCIGCRLFFWFPEERLQIALSILLATIYYCLSAVFYRKKIFVYLFGGLSLISVTCFLYNPDAGWDYYSSMMLPVIISLMGIGFISDKLGSKLFPTPLYEVGICGSLIIFLTTLIGCLLTKSLDTTILVFGILTLIYSIFALNDLKETIFKGVFFVWLAGISTAITYFVILLKLNIDINHLGLYYLCLSPLMIGFSSWLKKTEKSRYANPLLITGTIVTFVSLCTSIWDINIFLCVLFIASFIYGIMAYYLEHDDEISPLYWISHILMGIVMFTFFLRLSIYFGEELTVGILIMLTSIFYYSCATYFFKKRMYIYPALVLSVILTALILRYYMFPIREWSPFMMILGTLMCLVGSVVKDEGDAAPLYRIGASVNLLALIGVASLILITGTIIWHDIIAILIVSILLGISGYFTSSKYCIYVSIILCSLAYLLTLLILNVSSHLLGIWTISFFMLLLIIGYLLKKSIFANPLNVVSQLGCSFSLLYLFYQLFLRFTQEIWTAAVITLMATIYYCLSTAFHRKMIFVYLAGCLSLLCTFFFLYLFDIGWDKAMPLVILGVVFLMAIAYFAERIKSELLSKPLYEISLVGCSLILLFTLWFGFMNGLYQPIHQEWILLSVCAISIFIYSFLAWSNREIFGLSRVDYTCLAGVSMMFTYAMFLFFKVEPTLLGIYFIYLAPIMIGLGYLLKRLGGEVTPLLIIGLIIPIASLIISVSTRVELPILPLVVSTIIYTWACYLFEKEYFAYISYSSILLAYFFILNRLNAAFLNYGLWILTLIPILAISKDKQFSKKSKLFDIGMTVSVVGTLAFVFAYIKNLIPFPMLMIIIITLASTIYLLVGYVVRMSRLFYLGLLMFIGSYYILLLHLELRDFDLNVIPVSLLLIYLGFKDNFLKDKFLIATNHFYLAGLILLFVPQLSRSFETGGLYHALILFIFSLASIFFGMVRKIKAFFFMGIVAFVVNVLVQVFIYLHLGSLPKSIWGALVGLLLIGIGFFAEKRLNNILIERIAETKKVVTEKFSDWK